MSIQVPKSSITDDFKTLIRKKCNVTPYSNSFNRNPDNIALYDSHTKGQVAIPLSMWHEFYTTFPNMNCNRMNEYKELVQPLNESNRDQQYIIDYALTTLLKHHTILLSLYTGFGKTITAIIIAHRLRLKTLILCHISRVKMQWIDAIHKVLGNDVKVQHIEKGNTLNKDADFYICGIIKSKNIDAEQYNGIGTVIVDECHQICTDTFSISLLRIHPRYSIGLSATPNRTDGLHKILRLFFYYNKHQLVHRDIQKQFTVYKVMTGITPTIQYLYNGSLNWSVYFNSLAYNKDRQRIIADILMRNQEYKILVLGQRVDELRAISEIVNDESNQVTELYVRNMKKWNNDVDVLFGTMYKIGVGFDDSSYNQLFIITPFSKITQYEGRMRGNNYIVYDFVDAGDTSEALWRKRLAHYTKKGATIIVQEVNSIT